jgi:hypothetical protein
MTPGHQLADQHFGMPYCGISVLFSGLLTASFVASIYSTVTHVQLLKHVLYLFQRTAA